MGWRNIANNQRHLKMISDVDLKIIVRKVLENGILPLGDKIFPTICHAAVFVF